MRNADGSRLRITPVCPAAPDDKGTAPTRYVIAYAAPGSDRYRPAMAPLDAADEEIRFVDFIDLDNDGIQEVQVTGTCGAGPNCEGTLYRLDPASGRLSHFFSGAWADIRILDGHLVEAGRASCCAWEYHAWPLLPGPQPQVADAMAFIISVGWLGNEDEADCRFRRATPDGSGEVIAPPNAQWLPICELYGSDYHLALPGTVTPQPAADDSADTPLQD
ncbi:hypothetical protein LDO26_12105 [Luteimonas sp. BDR2-5]|uniref:hypothetical protein n=1 Tax=Proluteimonas luteida TaxID=2878685 RepID=UPI001E53CA34|nr:hypothetical protein [Luteimonas sp. BDR2-5]MCD9028950.1 hypothetical protein [Luteimonas sp. BDR2-5]